MQSFNRRRKRELKQELVNRFAEAEYTAKAIGSYLNSENKPPHPWDFFPEMFSEEREVYEEWLQQEQQEAAREARKAYAAEFNRRREMGLV